MTGEPILTATDGSESRDRALEAAIGLALRFDAELIIVNVEQGYLHGDIAATPLEASGIEEILYAVSSAILRNAPEKGQPVRPAEHTHIFGPW
jgi:nucleotide-binding universal stress UspA family protein